jgi:hypothetical protein
MTLPGFAADASLYKTSAQYWMAGTPNDLVGSREILPQLPIGFCMADCDFTHPSDPFLADVCKLGCLGGGDGGGGNGGGGDGGGGEPHCRPKCTPCRSDLESETGRSKTCVSLDCESNKVSC